jgi:hypothetical protein
MITPIPKHEGILDRLRREGRLIERKAPPDLSEIKRFSPTPGVPLPSEQLQLDREDRV